MSAERRFFKQVLRETEILQGPSRRLATFGETRISYFFLSKVEGFADRCRLREGVVLAQKPKILTAELFRDRFEGFGKDSAEFGRWLADNYGDSFRGLEYKFKNEGASAHIEHSTLQALAEQIRGRLSGEAAGRSAVLRGPDRAWQVGLMKFIVDECMASFRGNLQELEEHGLFDSPEKVAQERKKLIGNLFQRARSDRSLVPYLGSKLREFGLFKEYEDRFFSLFKN